jgi:hypothetical protein
MNFLMSSRAPTREPARGSNKGGTCPLMKRALSRWGAILCPSSTVTSGPME